MIGTQQIDKPSIGELRHLAHEWANRAALAAAGHARGLGWRAVKERAENRDRAKKTFLSALEKVMAP